jgi:hypothetical protein
MFHVRKIPFLTGFIEESRLSENDSDYYRESNSLPNLQSVVAPPHKVGKAQAGQAGVEQAGQPAVGQLVGQPVEQAAVGQVGKVNGHYTNLGPGRWAKVGAKVGAKVVSPLTPLPGD